MNRTRYLAATVTAGLLAVQSVAPAQTTIFTEDFEGAFPGYNEWSVGDANTNGTTAYWDDVNSSFGDEGTHAGSGKGYCAGVGYSGSTSSPSYRDYMLAYMDVDIDLSGYSSATLTFYYKMPSVDDDEDYGRVLIDYNGSGGWTTTWVRGPP